MRDFIVLTLVSLLACSSCSSIGSLPPEQHQIHLHQGTTNLSQLLAELDQLEPAPGTNPAQLGQLKQALRDYLTSSGITKFAAIAPSGGSNAVSDLTPDLLLDDLGNEQYRVSWSYRNIGDYDQNSEVNIGDLSALGANLGKTTASPDWDSKARFADGDNNGEVNISDITPLGGHLLSQVKSHRLESSDAVDGPWTAVTSVDFSTSAIEPSGLRMFVVPITGAPANFYRVVPADSAGNDGVASNSSQSFVISDKAEIVGAAGGVQFVSRNGFSMVLQAPDTDPTSIAVGDVLVGDDENGYLWRVLTVDQVGDQVTVTGEAAALTDFVVKGVINLSKLFAPDPPAAQSASASKSVSTPHPLEIDCTHVDMTFGTQSVTLENLHFEIAPDLQVMMSVNGIADPDNPVQAFVCKMNTDILEYNVDVTLNNAVFNGTFPADPENPAYRSALADYDFNFEAEINGVPFEATWTLILELGLAGSGDFNGSYQFNSNSTYTDALFGGFWNPLQGWQDYNQFTSTYADPVPGTSPLVTSTATGTSELHFYLLGSIEARMFDDTTRSTKLSFRPEAEMELTPTSVPSDGDLYQINAWLELGRDFVLGSHGAQVLDHSSTFIESPAGFVDSGFIARSGPTDKTISGRVTDGTNGIPGVFISGEMTGFPGTLWPATTNANGDYTLSGISPGLNVSVFPDPQGLTPYSFVPTQLDFPNIQSDQTGADFVGTAVTTWTHTLGINAGENDSTLGVAGDAAGNTYTCGFATEPVTTETMALVAKYGPTGNLLWSKQEGVAFIGSARFDAIAVDANGIYTVGTFDNENTFNQEMLVMKWDSDGNVVWKQSWGFGSTSSGWACALDTSGNLYVGGECSNGGTSQDAAVLKFDQNGNLLWQKAYAASGTDFVRGGFYDAGNFYLTGHSPNPTPALSEDVSMLKVFNTGSVSAAELYDVGSLYNAGLSVLVDGSFNTIIAGSTVAADGLTSDGLLIKLDSFNAPSASAGFEVNNPSATFHQFNGIRRDGFGNIVAGGYWNDGSQLNGTLAVFDSSLALSSLELLNGIGATRLYALDMDKTDGDVLLGGYAPNSVSIWSTGTASITTPSVTQTAYSGTMGDVLGTVNPPPPFTSDNVVIEDTGNGGTDALIIKRNLP